MIKEISITHNGLNQEESDFVQLIKDFVSGVNVIVYNESDTANKIHNLFIELNTMNKRIKSIKIYRTLFGGELKECRDFIFDGYIYHNFDPLAVLQIKVNNLNPIKIITIQKFFKVLSIYKMEDPNLQDLFSQSFYIEFSNKMRGL